MNPEELMRSRYEAFVQKDWNYLAQTSINQTVEELSHSSSIEWLKLDVLNSDNNTVEFKAFYKENGKVNILHEMSTFVKVDGIWKYQEGELYNTKIERNESCPCGSGKKFKKCCG